MKHLNFLLSAFLGFVLPALLHAQKPIKIADEVKVNVSTAHPYQAKKDSGYVFRKEFHSENSSYIKLYFENFNLSKGDYVVLYSPDRKDDKVVYAGGGKRVNSGDGTISDFWSRSVMDDKAILELYSAGNPGSYGFDVTQVAYGFPESRIRQLTGRSRSICGNDDKEEVFCYDGTQMYTRSEAVCRLVINGGSLCTGWLLGAEGHVMTNNHCIGTASDAQNTEFQFNYRYDDCSGNSTATTDVVAQSSTLICTDAGLDYTLVELPVNPTGTYGYLSFRSSIPNVGERIYIPQHPGGSRKKISVVDDQSGSGNAEITSNGTNRVEYMSDTEGGSSGSPVISYNDHFVLALHNTGGCPNGGNRNDNIINDMGTCMPNGGVDDPGGSVVASFEPDVIKSCNGTVDFTENSINATNYSWDFGDGGTSTTQEPSYSYGSDGSYTVTLIVDDGSGNADTATQDVYVAIQSDPTSTTGDTICNGNSATLSASGSGTLAWFDSQSGNNQVGTGTSFTTPSLSSTTDYYVGTIENTTTQNVGPTDNTIGGGAYFDANDNWGVNFDVEIPIILESVLVYSDLAGNRTIELLENGIVIQSKTVNISTGQQRINLGFEVPAGKQFLLKVTGSTVNLYRNSGGANYPYEIPGLVSITGNNTSSGTADDYYYYFYDWEVREKPCTSNLLPVTAEVTPSSLSMILNNPDCYGDCDGTAEVNASGGSGNFTYQWDDPNNQTTQTATGLCSGAYSVTVTDSALGCSATDSLTLNGPSQPLSLSLTGDTVTQGNCDGQAIVNASGGTTLYSYQWDDPNNQTSSIASGLCPGTYSVIVTDAKGCKDTGTVVIHSVTSVEVSDAADQRLQVHPVPAQEQLNVTMPGAPNGAKVRLSLYNVLGDLVEQREVTMNKASLQLDVKGYSEGIYFLGMERNGEMFREKIVIER